jgi:hypothetical protein
MDADVDRSDDQMDIARGRGLVDSVFQGAGMQDGTHNAIMVGSDYQSDGLKNLANIEDGTTSPRSSWTSSASTSPRTS